MATSLRDKITAGKRVTGTWVAVPDVSVVEILAQAGFDYLLIDGEHGPIPPAALPPVAVAAERRGCPIVYRVQANRGDLIKAALDVGVDGLMVPMVETPAEALAIVEAAKYPPAGRRGFGPWRASNYFLDLPAYQSQANDRIAIIPQIESAKAVENAAEIAAVPGIDALFVGPADLCGSLGVPVGAIEPKLIAALEKVVAAGKKTGRAVGIDAVSQEKFALFAKMGFTLFTYGSDLGYLADGAKAAADMARGIAN
ncbi:MAG TPA: aldolase/citrate lyase family protein [Dongiaceae bacterium]|jgi:4-hydroxy-2-oxoheptanedioate aldolase